MNLQRLYNPLVRWLLRSPLHRVMSGSTLLLTYTGRRSGHEHSLPVNYTRDGEMLLLVGARDHYRRYWGADLDAGGNPAGPEVMSRIATGNTLVRIGSLQPAM